MTEGRIAKARGAAELAVESLLRVLRQMLVEIYMEGFVRGLECAGNVEETERRLNAEAERPEDGVVIMSEGPTVRLKPDAILKRRLKESEFPVRVWRTLKNLNIETLGDILQVSEKFYISQDKFGLGSLNVLRNYVKRFGYKLKEK